MMGAVMLATFAFFAAGGSLLVAILAASALLLLLLVVARVSRHRWLPLCLVVAGGMLCAAVLIPTIGQGRYLREYMAQPDAICPDGVDDARAMLWAWPFAVIAATTAAVWATRRGRWAAAGAWGGTFVAVYAMALAGGLFGGSIGGRGGGWFLLLPPPGGVIAAALVAYVCLAAVSREAKAARDPRPE